MELVYIAGIIGNKKAFMIYKGLLKNYLVELKKCIYLLKKFFIASKRMLWPHSSQVYFPFIFSLTCLYFNVPSYTLNFLLQHIQMTS